MIDICHTEFPFGHPFGSFRFVRKRDEKIEVSNDGEYWSTLTGCKSDLVKDYNELEKTHQRSE